MPGLDALAVGGGVTDPRDARHAVGGLLALQGPTALDVRTGVIAAPGSTTLLTGTTKTGPKMSVLIGAHVAVTSRGVANGAYLGPSLEAPLEVDVDLAPASGSRIDVVYVKQRDTTSGVPTPDATAGPLYGVLTGTVSTGTPAKPNLADIVGAEELGTVRVSAGATSTNGAGVTITNTARQTVARGGIRPATAADTAAGTYIGEYRDHATNGLERWDGTRWSTAHPLGLWVNDLFSTTYGLAVPTTYSDLSGMQARVVQLPPGRTLEVEFSCTQANLGANSSGVVQLYVGGAVQDAGYLSSGASATIQRLALTGSYTNMGTTPLDAAWSVAGQTLSASFSINAGSYGNVRLRHRTT